METLENRFGMFGRQWLIVRMLNEHPVAEWRLRLDEWETKARREQDAELLKALLHYRMQKQA